MLKGKTALITGSTSGIGWAIAQAFARRGANVMLHGLGDRDANEALRARLEKEAGVRVKLHDANLADPAEGERLVLETEAQVGGVDILVNNAGIQSLRGDLRPRHRFNGAALLRARSHNAARRAIDNLLHQLQRGRALASAES